MIFLFGTMVIVSLKYLIHGNGHSPRSRSGSYGAVMRLCGESSSMTSIRPHKEVEVMNTDIRLDIDFFGHPKTIKLLRKLGPDGVISLQRLWLFAAKHKCSGDLLDMDMEEIAIAAGWSNDPSTFVGTLVEIRILDCNDGTYVLHNWKKRNGYASSAGDRSDKSRFSQLARKNRALYDDLSSQGYTAISAEEYSKLMEPKRVESTKIIRNVLRNVGESYNEMNCNSITNGSADRSAPLPPPLPIPIPKTLKEDVEDACAKVSDILSMDEIKQLHISFIGVIPQNPVVYNLLKEIRNKYPPDRVREAFRRTAGGGAEKPCLNYTIKILDNKENWVEKGDSSNGKNGNGNNSRGSSGSTAKTGRTGIIPPCGPDTDWLGGTPFAADA